MRRAAVLIALLLCSFAAEAQIVNRLKVDDEVFQRYAWGRMQMYNPDNLVLADSLYQAGVLEGNFRYKCLGLALEFPVRFAQGNYGRMDEAVGEIKQMLKTRPDTRAFYFSVINEYCQYLIHAGRAADAMLEAREMERLANRAKNALGKMYSYRIVGLIQSYRSNSWLAVENFEKAAQYCKEAKAEHELPNLLVLIAQEQTKLGEFDKAEKACTRAEEYQAFFPSMRIKTLMTRAYLYNAREEWESFWQCYDTLVSDPLYEMQTESDSRCRIDVVYLRSKGLFEQALARADQLGTAKDRHSMKHGIYAATGRFDSAYGELSQLMNEKDSIYIKVQNEDLAILDAEMNNAQLREDAARLKAQNQATILVGFLLMFLVAFVAILLSQWQLRQNLDELRNKNSQMLQARIAYRKFFDSIKEKNALKLMIMLNRKSNNINL
ncbi:MAG: hypothetical protein IJ686_04645 [Bacteroidales bacterium]|nr:hypothetical protein [Bacteroidales bacterium]